MAEQQWTFVRYELTESRRECDACGTNIKHLYHIANGEQRMVVGSECVNQWTAPDQRGDARAAERRANRAAAQWREKRPAPRDGETRAEYINRRVEEMGNAFAASKAYNAILAKHRAPNLTFVARDMLRRQGKGPNLWRATREEQDRWHEEHVKPLSRNLMQQLVDQYNANPYDFARPLWDVRKI